MQRKLCALTEFLSHLRACDTHLGTDRACSGNNSPGAKMGHAICTAKGARTARDLAGKLWLEPGRVKAAMAAIMALTVSLHSIQYPPLEEHQKHKLLFRVGRKAICKSRIKIRR